MSQRMERPLLAITMGDPAGVGPEIILKALRRPEVYARCRPLVIGDRRILSRAAPWVGVDGLRYEATETPESATYVAGTITLSDLGNADPQAVAPGQVSAICGRAAVEYVVKACDMATSGTVDAVVTGPLNKAAMSKAGFAYPGHTELLAERTGASTVSMLLVGPTLRVVHVSTHVSMLEAVRRVTCDRVADVIDLADTSCRMLGVESPRIAVAGLNPHAGEGGLFGHEEREIVAAVSRARARGLTVSDPLPPDTVFWRAARGEFDIVVAMYHDQGHIPMKMLAFDDAVNVSVGLPIIRTSVDHGTAFDIAGTGRVRESSLLAAIDVALQMVAARRGRPTS